MNKLILSTLAILMLTACLSQANVQWSRKIEGGKSANLIGVSENGMYVLKNKGKKKYIDRYNINDFTFEKSSEIVFPMGLKKVSGITVEMLNDKIVMYYYSKEVKDRVSLWITTFNSFTLEQQPPLKITSKHVNPKPKNSLMMVTPYPYYPPIFNFRYSENQKKIVFWGWDCKHGYQRGFQKLSHIEVYTLDENLEKVNRQKFEIPENLYNIEESSCNNSDLLCFLTYKTLTKPVVQNNQGEKLQRAIQEKTLFSSVDKEDLENLPSHLRFCLC